MTKRLQIILQDPEYREIQRMARARHMSLAEWVRQALQLARRREPIFLLASFKTPPEQRKLGWGTLKS